VKRLALLAVIAGCSGDVDPPWQLDHDRIVAVRATPPRIITGEQSDLDALLAHKGEMTSNAPPELAGVLSPASLADVLALDAGRWKVTAPSEARLAMARTELGLAADASVPLTIGVSYDAGALVATKIVWLGDSETNPPLVDVRVDGAAPPAQIVIAPAVDVPLSVMADDAVDNVNWLTSCGTMHDFDLAKAHIHVEPKDPTMGELAVIVRNARGGVAWQVWPIRAQ